MTAVTEEQLLGGWQLEQFEISFSDQRPPLFPFGHGPSGMLVYSSDGTMAITIAKHRRGDLSIEHIEDLRSAQEGEKAQAFESFLSYAGTWTLEDDQLSHVVEVASVPNLVGQEQVQSVELWSGRLYLRYLVTAASGIVRRYELIWRRR